MGKILRHCKKFWTGLLLSNIFILNSFASVPTNVQFTFASTDTLTASWTLDSPSEQPLMLISTSSDFSTLISSDTGDLGAQTTTYFNLTPNTTYYFKVKVSTEPDYSVTIATSTKPNPPLNPVINSCGETSCNISWGDNNNSGESFYFIQAAKDSAFTMSVSSSLKKINDSPFDMTGLTPDTTYFFRIKTKGFSQADSSFVSFGSTITLSQMPSSPDYSLVNSTEIIFNWNTGLNPPWTEYNLNVSSDSGVPDLISTTTTGNYIKISGLIPNTTYYSKVRSKNGYGYYSDFIDFSSTLTYANIPSTAATTFKSRDSNYIEVQWNKNSNPDGTWYYLYVSTSSDFGGIDFGKGWTTLNWMKVDGLESAKTYYFRVKAKDSLSRETEFKYLGYESTLYGADTTPPSIIDLQDGDDTWRSNSSGNYSVYFNDMGSMLSKFQIKITTTDDYNSEAFVDWTDIAVNINSEDFNTAWQIPSQIFQTLSENTTYYVSVRVFDNANNISTATVFYIKRDTTPPEIVNYAVSPSDWKSSDGVWNSFDVDFFDFVSGLNALYYSASDTQDTANGNILGWTNINFSSPAVQYTSNWRVNFESLKDGVTNYISVKGVDLAGNYTIKKDVFKILKNTKGPPVTITSPNSIFVSTLSIISGNTSKPADNVAIEKTEISLLKKDINKYWSGSSYDSDFPIWINLGSNSIWSYDVSTFTFINNSSYSVIARAMDLNSRYSDPYSTFTFTIDRNPPFVSITTPSVSSVYNLEGISGTSSDSDSGIRDVRISLKRIADNKFWNFFTNTWVNSEIFITLSSTGDWSYSFNDALKGNLLNNFEYVIKVYSTDLSYPENFSSPSFSTFTFYDNIPPAAPADIIVSTYSAPGKMTIQWKFGGDDATVGYIALGGFAINYSTHQGINYSTSNAQINEIITNIPSNSTYTYTISSLESDTTYYFKIWIKDDAGLWSSPSSEISGVSGKGLENQIAGEVRNSRGEGITGVLIEVLDYYGLPVSNTYTIDDGNGSYIVNNIADGIYKVRATWVYNGIASSVSKDRIPMGYNGVDFIISTDYSLSSISGYVSDFKSEIGILSVSAPKVYLYQNEKLILTKECDSKGYFKISNLLPGNYKLKFSGKEYIINLKEGENYSFSPQIALTNEIYVYPNPAKTNATFHLEVNDSAAQKEISVFTIDGRLIKKIKNSDIENKAGNVYEYDFNLSSVSSGIYLCIIKIRSRSSGDFKKVIKLGVIK